MIIDKFNNNIETLKEETIKLLVDSIDSDDWKVKLKVINGSRIEITINKVIRKCYLCEKKHSVNDLIVRQDKRVTKLFLPKLVCKFCVVGVDNSLDKLKQLQPKHLKLLSNQLDK